MAPSLVEKMFTNYNLYHFKTAQLHQHFIQFSKAYYHVIQPYF